MKGKTGCENFSGLPREGIMELGIINPYDTRLDIIEEIVNKEFPEINVTILRYADYKDVAGLLQDVQLNFDALLFSGSFPYDYARFHLKKEVIWDYIARLSGALLRALLVASQPGYDLQRISFDYYSEGEIQKIFNEQGLHVNPHLTMDYKTIFGHRDVDKYNESIYQFHKRKWSDRQVDVCITTSIAVSRWLEQEGIPCIFVYPTNDDCRETIRRLYTTYIANKYQKSQIVILSLEIGYPDEYSLFAENENVYLQDKTKILSHIYSFAAQINGIVVEVTYRNYLLFTTKSILEVVTDNFRHFTLLTELADQYLSKVSVGIGYGETAGQAKVNANKGLMQSKKYDTNVAFVYYSEQALRGPLGVTSDVKKNDEYVNEKLYAVSQKALVGMNNLFKLYTIISQTNRNIFTVKELASLMSMQERSINRIVSNLEAVGYIKVIGKKPALKKGRPSRIIRIDFNFNET